MGWRGAKRLEVLVKNPLGAVSVRKVDLRWRRNSDWREGRRSASGCGQDHIDEKEQSLLLTMSNEKNSCIPVAFAALKAFSS